MPGFPKPCCLLLCQIAIIAIHSWSTLFFTPWALYGFPIPISASCLSSAWPRASSLMAPRISVPTSCSTAPSYLLLSSLPQSSVVPFLFAVPCLSMPSLQQGEINKQDNPDFSLKGLFFRFCCWCFCFEGGLKRERNRDSAPPTLFSLQAANSRVSCSHLAPPLLFGLFGLTVF